MPNHGSRPRKWVMHLSWSWLIIWFSNNWNPCVWILYVSYPECSTCLYWGFSSCIVQVNVFYLLFPKRKGLRFSGLLLKPIHSSASSLKLFQRLYLGAKINCIPPFWKCGLRGHQVCFLACLHLSSVLERWRHATSLRPNLLICKLLLEYSPKLAPVVALFHTQSSHCGLSGWPLAWESSQLRPCLIMSKWLFRLFKGLVLPALTSGGSGCKLIAWSN